jgi:hypothetical protein
VVSGRRCGSRVGGPDISGTGDAGASSTGDAGVSSTGVLESGGAEGATITAPMNMTKSNVTDTRKKSRAAFIRAAWVIGRLRCPAVASLIAGIGQRWAVERPARRRGQRGAGRVRLGAVTSNPEGPPGEQPVWRRRDLKGDLARRLEREPGTPKRPGWFDNRSATITLNRKTGPGIAGAPARERDASDPDQGTSYKAGRLFGTLSGVSRNPPGRPRLPGWAVAGFDDGAGRGRVAG